jgi:DNA-binding Xre family transcriptional regulator
MKINIDKLEVCMARKCVNIDELSRMAGISKYTLYAFKSAQRNLTAKTIGKIAKALDTDVTEIID